MYKVMVTTQAVYGEYNVVVTVIEFDCIADATVAVKKINSRGNNRYDQKALPLNFDV